MSEDFAAPPAKSRRRFPRWVGWLLGVPCALVVAFFVLLPPQRPASLAGWTPKCAPLEAEDWRELCLDSEAGAMTRAEAFRLDPRWMVVGEGMVLSTKWGTSDTARTYWCAVPAAPGQPLARAAVPAPCSSSETMALIAWPSGQEIWVQHEQQVQQHFEKALIALDAQTLLETRQVPLEYADLPAGYRVAGGSALYRRAVLPDGRWELMAKLPLRSGQGRGSRSQSHVARWLFDPISGEVSSGRRVQLPGQVSATIPPGAVSLGLLTEDWYVSEDLYDPSWVAVSGFDASAGELQMQHIPASLDHNYFAKPHISQLRPGWFGQDRDRWLRSRADCAASLEFQTCDLPGRLHEAAFRPLRAVPSQSLGAARLSSFNLALHAQSELEGNFGQRMVVPETLRLTTSWAGDLPRDPNLEQASFATISTLRWLTEIMWNDVPGLWCWPIGGEKFLFIQLVRNPARQGEGVTGDCFRLGTLTAPDTRIVWHGTMPVPANLRQCRDRVELSAYVEDDALRLALTAVEDHYPQGAKRYFWWTRVPWPADLEPEIRGWLRSDIRYQLAWQAATQGATSQSPEDVDVD